MNDEDRRAHPTPATLHDVAREAGLSLATASRVLNGADRKATESFRERVKSATPALGYTANASAQATARGMSAAPAELASFGVLGGRSVTFGPGGDRSILSDVIAVGAMAAVRQGCRSIGADIAICGFDDVPISRDITPRLTTVRLPLSDLGYQAFRATVDERWEPDPVELEVKARESTPEVVT